MVKHYIPDSLSSFSPLIEPDPFIQSQSLHAAWNDAHGWWVSVSSSFTPAESLYVPLANFCCLRTLMLSNMGCYNLGAVRELVHLQPQQPAAYPAPLSYHVLMHATTSIRCSSYSSALLLMPLGRQRQRVCGCCRLDVSAGPNLLSAQSG
jgi:hypothetical protein